MIQSGQAKMNESGDRAISLDGNQTFYAKEEEKWYGQETLDAPESIQPESIFKAENIKLKNGIVVSGRFILADSAKGLNPVVDMPPEMAAGILYKVARDNYFYWNVGHKPSPQEENEFLQKWLAVQQGGSASDIESHPPSWLAGIPGKKMGNTPLRRFSGQPGDVNTVEIIYILGTKGELMSGYYGKRDDKPRATMVFNANMYGETYETELDLPNGILRYYVGVPYYTLGQDNPSISYAMVTKMLLGPNGWIARNNGIQNLTLKRNQALEDKARIELVNNGFRVH